MNFVKSISIAFTLAAATSATFAASAPSMPTTNLNPWYVGVRGAVNFPTSGDFDTGFAANIEAGHTFNFFALEGELGYLQNDVRGYGSGNYESKTYGLVNGYVRFKNHTNFTPYLGLGAGIAHIYAQASAYGFEFDESTNSFAYQGIAGMSYQWNDHWSTSLDYRYFNTTQTVKYTTHVGSNLVTLGVDYHF